MGLLDFLSRYHPAGDVPPPQVLEDFDRVSQEASPEDIEMGLEDAFNSDVTPPFEQMVGQLYGESDEDTRAALMKEVLGNSRSIPPHDIERVAAEARRQNPSIVQQVSRFYARHPQLVQVLGQAALSILMSGMARRRRI